MSTVTTAPTEHAEQVALVRWAEFASLTDPRLNALFAIPNGGHRHRAVAGKLKAEGVKAGVCDLFLAVPNFEHHGLFIEMKRTKGSNTSAAQAEFMEMVQGFGYRAEVCKGCDAAIAVIEDYLGYDIGAIAPHSEAPCPTNSQTFQSLSSTPYQRIAIAY